MPTIELSILLATVAFTLSAAAGLGGSLILVPALAMLLGAKQGVAIAALLLALNNVAKTVAYRDALPLRDVALVVALTALGAAVGARMLLAAPEGLIQVGIVVSLVSAALLERRVPNTIRTALVPLFAFGAGATSGFTGTSGPLKAVALRSLGHDRLHFVGAASLVSLSADAVKAALLIHALPVAPASWAVVAGALPGHASSRVRRPADQPASGRASIFRPLLDVDRGLLDSAAGGLGPGTASGPQLICLHLQARSEEKRHGCKKGKNTRRGTRRTPAREHTRHRVQRLHR